VSVTRRTLLGFALGLPFALRQAKVEPEPSFKTTDAPNWRPYSVGFALGHSVPEFFNEGKRIYYLGIPIRYVTRMEGSRVFDPLDWSAVPKP
jgi:hypothetical protein